MVNRSSEPGADGHLPKATPVTMPGCWSGPTALQHLCVSNMRGFFCLMQCDSFPDFLGQFSAAVFEPTLLFSQWVKIEVEKVEHGSCKDALAVCVIAVQRQRCKRIEDSVKTRYLQGSSGRCRDCCSFGTGSLPLLGGGPKTSYENIRRQSALWAKRLRFMVVSDQSQRLDELLFISFYIYL